MKSFYVSLILFLMTCPLHAGKKEQTTSVASSVQSTTRILEINRIGMWVNDRGYLYNKVWTGGAIWPDTGLNASSKSIVYDHGPWIIGKVSGVPSAAMALWESSYAPGPIVQGKPALWVRPQDSSIYHPYRINGSSSDSDLVTWPSDLGAPVDAQGRPLLLGDELIWSVFNGADTSAFPENYRVTKTQFPRLPVEVRQSVYAQRANGASDTSLLANTVFLEWKFINKGNAPIESCYVGFWSDIDFDLPGNNVPGIDTTLQLGYCWAPDSGRTTKAVGYQLLYGPVSPDPESSALFCGKSLAGYRNMGLTSFRGILNDVGHDFLSAPNTIDECWNLARGFDQAGGVMIDSVSKLPTRFPYSGDPVTRTGWVYSQKNRNGSAGVLMFAGPFNLAAGDSQWMMLALIPANAGDRLASISLMRDHAKRLRGLTYNTIAQPRALGVALDVQAVPLTMTLSQNYPNPFNPSTTIRYSLTQRSHVSLLVFNTLGQQVATLVHGDQEAGYHEVRFDGSGLASGVYFYRIQAGTYVDTKKLLLLK